MLAGIALLCLTACGHEARVSLDDATGPNPALPAPHRNWLPTVKVPRATGWPDDGRPQAATGLQVSAFATGLNHPRWLYVLPNGDVLVAETSAPSKPVPEPGLRAMVQRLLMKRAGAAVPSANRILLLRDADQDGIAETRTVFLAGLHSPFGMALVGDDFYVANTDALLRWPYVSGATQITEAPAKLLDLPAGPFNYHWTKNLLPSLDGKHLYLTVGSNSNVAEHGLERETGRAAIWQMDLASGAHRVFASGLRNPNGLAWEPASGRLWTVVNERDELGSDLVPDYLTSVVEGAFYGWPYSYFGQIVDTRVPVQRPDLVATARRPDYALGAHTASLGLAYHDGRGQLDALGVGMYIGQHGSWNRKPLSGYRVIFVPFADGMPSGLPQDVLTGFVNQRGEACGRPVGVVVDHAGALLVADDVGNTVWRVTRANN
ncbi:MAG: sorbosone dehydrogenase family protein [Polyangiaceae bacterium]